MSSKPKTTTLISRLEVLEHLSNQDLVQAMLTNKTTHYWGICALFNRTDRDACSSQKKLMAGWTRSPQNMAWFKSIVPHAMFHTWVEKLKYAVKNPRGDAEHKKLCVMMLLALSEYNESLPKRLLVKRLSDMLIAGHFMVRQLAHKLLCLIFSGPPSKLPQSLLKMLQAMVGIKDKNMRKEARDTLAWMRLTHTAAPDAVDSLSQAKNAQLISLLEARSEHELTPPELKSIAAIIADLSPDKLEILAGKLIEYIEKRKESSPSTESLRLLSEIIPDLPITTLSLIAKTLFVLN